ncbi:S-layer homology domain-containing protein [Paenibacillus sp. 1P07SE]|uniref:S-layer homology domain-containing protein n=1 Tax=Paenibacillus sp. 1P07SE TaxID=3132209 RepID=UPI0039A6C46E
MKKKQKKATSKKQLIVTLAAAVALAAVPAGAYGEVAMRADLPIPASTVDSAPGTPGAGAEEAPADVAVSRDRAIELARQIVKIPADYTLQSASYNTDRLANGTRSAWNLNFTKRDNNKHVGSIQARIHAGSGELLSYSTYLNDPTRKPVYPPKVDREQAQALAEAFIAQVGAKYADQLRFNADYGIQFRPPLNGEVRYQLRFNRLVGDIPFMDNYIDVEVDGEGHVMGYQVRWDDTVSFPEGQPSITLEEAGVKIRELEEPQLVYTLPYDMKAPVRPFLSYEMEAIMIDALSGERYQPFAAPTKPNTTDPVAPSALGSKPAANKNLTSEQAVKVVEDAFKLPAGSKLTDSSYHEYADERTGISTAAWQLNWTVQEDGKDTGSVWASVNSRTGEITTFYAYSSAELQGGDTVKIITYEEAKAKAVETVKKLLPGYAHELYLQETDKELADRAVVPGDIRDYNFRFQRQVHGARTMYEGVHVSINAISNEVRTYSAELSSFSYPAQKPQTITPDQAVEAYMDYYNLELTYVQTHQYNGEPIPLEKYNVMVAAGEIMPGSGDGGEAKLVYRLVPRPMDGQVFLDAQTGEWRDHQNGEVTSLVKQTATDIAGHWAERELSIMVAYKALDLEDGQVRPQAVVTRGEMIKMLVLSMNSGYRPLSMANGEAASASFKDVTADSEYFVYVESAVAANLIDRGDGSFDPDGQVDREEMAELIVRALGYNSLAKYEGLFNIPFNDAASLENKGQAAIVAGLKIMNPDDKGNFNPDRLVTRAESATAFFRFLQARADLQEAPLRN